MTEQVLLTTSPLPYRLTVEDFFRLDEAGAFEGYGKTELIRGEVFYMNAQHRPHARMKGQMHLALVDALKRLDGEVADKPTYGKFINRARRWKDLYRSDCGGRPLFA